MENNAWKDFRIELLRSLAILMVVFGGLAWMAAGH